MDARTREILALQRALRGTAQPAAPAAPAHPSAAGADTGTSPEAVRSRARRSIKADTTDEAKEE